MDVSAANPAVVSALSPNFTVAGTRPGLSYAAWAGGNPLLTDPDGDGDQDGNRNALEYAAGTDPLNPADRPSPVLAHENLTGQGLSDSEMVLRFPVAGKADDFTLVPSTSTDLTSWFFGSFKFLEAIDLGSSRYEMRFRVADPLTPRRFFRAENPEE